MSAAGLLRPGAGAGRREARVLFTCAGRRIELMQAFMRAARALGIKPLLHAADAEPCFAAGCLADQPHHVPPVSSPQYIPTLLRIAKSRKIDLLIPLLDVELPKLAAARADFAKVGCGAVISSPRVVRICRDKVKTYEFLRQNGIDTPQTWRAEEVLRRRHRFPYFLKPRTGSASKGNFIIRNQADLHALVPHVPDAIIQEFVPGVEYTLDVYAGFDGRPRCVVPRQRLEVRGGEVTKARTVMDREIINVGVRVVEALRECVGLITIQLVKTPDRHLRVIEINPRFGGGVPLGIHAGADFPKWLLTEWIGKQPRIRLANFRAGLVMLRYYQSYFINDLVS